MCVCVCVHLSFEVREWKLELKLLKLDSLYGLLICWHFSYRICSIFTLFLIFFLPRRLVDLGLVIKNVDHRFGGKPNRIGNQGVLLWLRLKIKRKQLILVMVWFWFY